MLGRLEMDIPTCINAYKRLATTIFSNKKSFPITCSGKIRPKFNAKPLEDAIKEIITEEGYSEEEAFKKPENMCKV